MVPLIIIVFLAIAFGGLVAFTVYLQRKEAVQFEQARKKHGWEEISRSGGYDVIPENEEKWKVEVRGGNSNSNASMTWSHSMSSHTPLVILPKSEIGVLNEIPIKGLRLLHSEILEDIKPISIGSENFGKRYLIYGNSEIEEHPFLTEKIQALLVSYIGADFMLVLFPNVLEIRLRDRNVKSQIPPLIQLGQEIITTQNPAE